MAAARGGAAWSSGSRGFAEGGSRPAPPPSVRPPSAQPSCAQGSRRRPSSRRRARRLASSSLGHVRLGVGASSGSPASRPRASRPARELRTRRSPPSLPRRASTSCGRDRTRSRGESALAPRPRPHRLQRAAQRSAVPLLRPRMHPPPSLGHVPGLDPLGSYVASAPGGRPRRFRPTRPRPRDPRSRRRPSPFLLSCPMLPSPVLGAASTSASRHRTSRQRGHGGLAASGWAPAMALPRRPGCARAAPSLPRRTPAALRRARGDPVLGADLRPRPLQGSLPEGRRGRGRATHTSPGPARGRSAPRPAGKLAPRITQRCDGLTGNAGDGDYASVTSRTSGLLWSETVTCLIPPSRQRPGDFEAWNGPSFPIPPCALAGPKTLTGSE